MHMMVRVRSKVDGFAELNGHAEVNDPFKNGRF